MQMVVVVVAVLRTSLSSMRSVSRLNNTRILAANSKADVPSLRASRAASLSSSAPAVSGHSLLGSTASSGALCTALSPASKRSGFRFYSTSTVTTPHPEQVSYPDQHKVDGYRKKGTDNRTFHYFLMSNPRFLITSATRLFVLQFLNTLSPSARVLALASIEVEIGAIPEGKTVTLKWRGKPVFIRHRTAGEIDIENAVPVESLKDPAPDSTRYLENKSDYVVLLGVCTHFGCVPVTDAGDVKGGFFCPCHGSHYDTSGRIRRGPAPKNLEIPKYRYISPTTIVIG